MFEISFDDKEKFENFKINKSVYINSEYDFTFEDRYVIYHTPLSNNITYYVFDSIMKRSSQVLKINKNSFRYRTCY